MSEIKITQAYINNSMNGLEELVNGARFNVRKKLENIGRRLDDSTYERASYAIHQSFPVIDIVWKELKKRKYDPKVRMISAAYIGAEYGLECLGASHTGQVGVSTQNVFSGEKVDFTRDYPWPLDALLGIYSKKGLDRYESIGLSNLTEQYFNWLKDKASIESMQYPQFKDQFSNVNGIIGEDFSFRGLSTKVKRGSKKSDLLTWDNFGGYHDVVKYFKRLENFVEGYDHVKSLGVLKSKEIFPKGVLLHGPPGTGKTSIIRIFCNEVGVPYEIFSISDVGGTHVNETSNAIQRKFDEAAGYIKRGESKLSVLAIDEIDAVGKKRSGKSNGSGEDDKSVGVICENMRGDKAVDGVIVFGMTNLGEVLDKALVSPGRFTKQIEMSYPNKQELKEIFDIYLKGRKGAEKINPDKIINKYSHLDWTGALVEKVIVDAQWEKVAEHLEGKKDYTITDGNICDKIEEHISQDLEKGWLE